jgi:aspartyl-tRNA(Asn)/glutamyl-tRNA(Gln) amidotransferase subunit A
MRETLDRFVFELTAPDLRYIHEFPGYGRPVPDLSPPSSFSTIHRSHYRIMSAEAAEVHGSRFDRHPNDYPPRIRELIEDGRRCSAVELVEAQREQGLVEVEIDNMIPGTYILTPATTGPAPGPESTGNPAMNSPWSFAGMPTISFPISWTQDGMPLAAQLTGSRLAEGSLFAAAAWAERLARFERRPLPLQG